MMIPRINKLIMCNPGETQTFIGVEARHLEAHAVEEEIEPCLLNSINSVLDYVRSIHWHIELCI
jgi:hypothetical protein